MKQLLVLLFVMFSSSVGFAQMHRVKVGKYQSRGLWQSSAKDDGKKPAIILIPGSGPNGPEEMMPPQVTVDGKSHSIFESVSRPFIDAGWNVLCLGKPGIEFHTGWDPEKRFYDKDLYMGLRWHQLIENLGEGIDFLRSQPTVDGSRVFVLGHSQGTQIAVDYASQHAGVSGLVLIGFSGEDIKSILDWQLFKRPIEHFVATDVDIDRDGLVSRQEAGKWPGPFDLDDAKFDWNFREGRDTISYAEIEEDLRSNPDSIKMVEFYRAAPFFAGGVFDRGPIYEKAAALTIPLYVFTGELDLRTTPKEAYALQEACRKHERSSCEVQIVPGLGYSFSPPREPRKHPLLDMTDGPVEESFLKLLSELIRRM